MDNFSKFLTNREDLKMVFESKSNSSGVYFIILLFLLAFFMLFPMWRIGQQGFALWLIWVIFLIFLLAKEIIGQNNIYLLTNKRIIHLKLSSKTDQKLIGFIKLSDINRVYKQRKNICIVTQNKKYYLSSIKQVDEFYKKLNSYIKD